MQEVGGDRVSQTCICVILNDLASQSPTLHRSGTHLVFHVEEKAIYFGRFFQCAMPCTLRVFAAEDKNLRVEL